MFILARQYTFSSYKYIETDILLPHYVKKKRMGIMVAAGE